MYWPGKWGGKEAGIRVLYGEDMMNFVNDRKKTLFITRNGESRAVLIDVESYQEMKNAFSLLQMLQFSETDVKNGKYRPAVDVFASLRRKYTCGD